MMNYQGKMMSTKVIRIKESDKFNLHIDRYDDS